MGEGISIDFGSAAPYIIDSVMALFGKDHESEEWRNKVEHLVRLSSPARGSSPRSRS